MTSPTSNAWGFTPYHGNPAPFQQLRTGPDSPKPRPIRDGISNGTPVLARPVPAQYGARGTGFTRYQTPAGSTRHKPSAGFTLVEILVASVILVVGIVGTIQVAVKALHAVQMVDEKVLALNRLEAEAVTLRSQAELVGGLAPSSWGGSWTDPRGAAWTAQAVASNQEELTQLDLQAQWSRSGRIHTIGLETLMLAPAGEE